MKNFKDQEGGTKPQEQFNHQFKKKFGQNFLTDKNLLQAIVADANVDKDDTVLEIGAGAGALTIWLSAKAKKVVSYEIDKDLKDNLEKLNLKNVQFVFKDALKEKTEDIEKLLGGKYKVVANLPYYITSPLIFKFLEEGKNVQSLTIMVQKEVADRMIAKPGGKDYGVLSVMTSFFGDAKITRTVGRQMFYPQPNVDSAVVNITINQKFKDIDRIDFYNFISACFSMRRKTLANNLAKVLATNKEHLAKKLENFDLTRRAESFSLQEFADMFKTLRDKKC